MKRVCNFNGWVIAERNREKRWVLNNAGNEICLELPGNKLNFYLEIIFCRGQALFSCVSANNHNVNSIGIEMNDDYYGLSQKIIKEKTMHLFN